MRGAFDKIASEAKPHDALVVMLIGHGSFDGVDYKINLPGPDLSATELAALLDRIPRHAPAGGQHDQRQRRLHRRRCAKPNRVVITATKTGTEKNATVFARYLGGSAARSGRRHRQERNDLRARSFPLRRAEDRRVLRTQKRLATEHADARRHRARARRARAVAPKMAKACSPAAFPLLRLGARAIGGQQIREKQKLLAKKEELEQQIDELKYKKAAMPPDEYKKQLTRAAAGAGEDAGGAGQVRMTSRAALRLCASAVLGCCRSCPNPGAGRSALEGSIATKTPTTRSARWSAAHPKNPDYRVRWGRLFLERFNRRRSRQAVSRKRWRSRKTTRARCSAWRWSPPRTSKARPSSWRTRRSRPIPS